ncbi:MAG: DUF2269 family protein [Chloroflexota bacterium]
MSAILLLKLAHILAAIVAVGANVTYTFWIRRAERDPQHLAWTIAGIRRLDRRISTPSYVLVLLTGLAMVAGGYFSFGTRWIQAALVLYVIVVILAIAVYAPTFRRQLRAAEVDPTSAEYRALSRRTQLYGWLVTGVVVVIIGLMVLKPAL